MRRQEDLSAVSDAAVRAWEPLVRSLTRRYRSENWVGDLAQEIRLWIAHGIATWSPDRKATLVTWVNHNALWGRKRFLGRIYARQARMVELPLLDGVIGGTDFRPASEARVDLELLMAHLTPRQRQIVVLKELMGFTAAEVARAGAVVSEGAARSRRDHAMRSMRRAAAAWE